MSTLSKHAYRTIDDAALGGFKRILVGYRHWTIQEYGFLIVEVKHEVLKRLGHEGVVIKEARYHYTEPSTEGRRDKIPLTVQLTPFMRESLRAFCHTHTVPGGFSGRDGDLTMFQTLKKHTKDKKLKHDVVFYLMNSDQQVRRAITEQDFTQGERIKGLDKAIP
jgi:hypothetical protein